MTPSPRLALVALLFASLSGCSAISNLSQATEPLNAYELQAPQIEPSSRAKLGNLYVELPISTGALDTDRIAVKPNPLLVQYLPSTRWVDRATEHFQLLLVRTLSETGRFGFVTGDTSGPTPDFVLLTDLTAFQAEIQTGPDGSETTRAVVRAKMTLLTDIDRAVIATRTIESAVPAQDSEPPAILAAMDAAAGNALREAADWAVGALR